MIHDIRWWLGNHTLQANDTSRNRDTRAGSVIPVVLSLIPSNVRLPGFQLISILIVRRLQPLTSRFLCFHPITISRVYHRSRRGTLHKQIEQRQPEQSSIKPKAHNKCAQSPVQGARKTFSACFGLSSCSWMNVLWLPERYRSRQPETNRRLKTNQHCPQIISLPPSSQDSVTSDSDGSQMRQTHRECLVEDTKQRSILDVLDWRVRPNKAPATHKDTARLDECHPFANLPYNTLTQEWCSNKWNSPLLEINTSPDTNLQRSNCTLTRSQTKKTIWHYTRQ